ncbi:MAG: hypothetical protein ACHQDC_04400 [Acidimicrobiales bacterium]
MSSRLSAVHRARRFATSLWWQVRGAPEPSPDDTVWAHAHLRGGEVQLVEALAAVDRRHCLGVARSVERELSIAPGGVSEADRWMVVAGLTHDVGKAPAHLGVLGRVLGTLLALTPVERDRNRSQRTGSSWWSRVRLYARYPDVGAGLLSDAGADTKVVAWAREHHRPQAEWSVPAAQGRLLAAADDGRL